MFCAISGQTPEEPVVSKGGHLFEKRLISKHLQEDGKCPVTGETLTAEDLTPLVTNPAVKPRPPAAASIPGLLTVFQNEWDAVMLEQHSLREQLNSVRQELSQALYQHDAACRVIARLKEERDLARTALANAQLTPAGPEVGTKRPAEDTPEEPAKKAKAQGITAEVVAAMTTLSKELSKSRKKRQAPPTLATPDEIEKYTCITSQPLHKTAKQGITCVDVHPGNKDVVATSGVDGNVVVFNRKEGKITSTITGHTKKVTGVQFVKDSEVLVSCSADKSARIWKQTDDGATYDMVKKISEHSAEITAISVHPTSKYFITASADKTWCFYDIETALCLTQVANSTVLEGFTCATFHPDGLILGTGTHENLVRIWDVKSQENVAKFEGHKSLITSMSFSENGYHLATAAADGVKLWDLRKPKNFRNLAPYPQGVMTTAVKFDTSGQYLAVGGSDARIYGVKQDWNVVQTFSDLPKSVTYTLFGDDAKSLYVTSMDHNLRVYGGEE